MVHPRLHAQPDAALLASLRGIDRLMFDGDPTSQMVANLKAGSIDGYCVGWNLVLFMKISLHATDLDIWSGTPGESAGCSRRANLYPQTHLALVKSPAGSLRVL